MYRAVCVGGYVDAAGRVPGAGQRVRVPLHPPGLEEGRDGAAARPSLLPDGPRGSPELEDDHGQSHDPRQDDIQGRPTHLKKTALQTPYCPLHL